MTTSSTSREALAQQRRRHAEAIASAGGIEPALASGACTTPDPINWLLLAIVTPCAVTVPVGPAAAASTGSLAVTML